MRSRYSAFVVADPAYLLATWHPDTRPSQVRINPDQRWLGLRIIDVSDGRTSDTTGTVEFVARFRIGGARASRLHERSRFEMMNDRWFYIDGEHL